MPELGVANEDERDRGVEELGTPECGARDDGALRIVRRRLDGEARPPALWLGRLRLPLTPPELDSLAQSCAPERRARAQRYRRQADKARCLAAGALVRAATGEDAQSDTEGKPFLSARLELSVSIAHAGEWVACAIHGGAVGVDVEDLDGPVEEGMPALFMSPVELARYQGMTEESQRRAFFFDVWTMKEAYTKAVGGHVRFHPTSVTVDDFGPWRRFRATLDGGYRLALIWEAP